MNRTSVRVAAVGSLILCYTCHHHDAPEVDVPVRADASGLAPSTTNLDYTIHIDAAQLAMADLHFQSLSGSAQYSLRHRLQNLLWPSAHAHPGHHHGGEVTGELHGEFLVDWFSDAPTLGVATLLAGRYGAMSFSLQRASEAHEDGLLFGHSIVLQGRADAGTIEYPFHIKIAANVGHPIIDAPCEVEIHQDMPAYLGFRILLQDPMDYHGLFDDINFEALHANGDGLIVIDAAGEDANLEAYQALRGRLQSHRFYDAILHAP